MPKINPNRSYVITHDNDIVATIIGSREYAIAKREELAIKDWRKSNTKSGRNSRYSTYTKHNSWKSISAKNFFELED